jgi:hypothetical protein
MRTGQRLLSSPAPDDGPRVLCPRCGRSFRSLRDHTSQVPRHLPPAKPAVLFRRRRPGCCTIGRVGDLATVKPPAQRDGAAAGVLPPPFVTVGPHCLRRVAAEFPDELLYVGPVGPDHDAWLKSLGLLEGPWEWVIQQGTDPIDFSDRRFPTRTDAAADLLEHLEVLIGAPASESHAPVVVAAAAGGPDPDAVAMALDLAILTLRKARAAFPAAAGARG